MLRVDADLWAQWERHRCRLVGADADRAVQLDRRGRAARHASFLTRLFAVGPEAEQMAATTRGYDDLFRFKIDFVRRRALPLLKAGTHVAATPEDHARVEQVTAATADPELAIARYGCSLFDRELAARAAPSETDAEKVAVAAEIESLKRWCAAHVHDPRFRQWVVFRFPETLDPMHLVHVGRSDPSLPEAMVGPRRNCAGVTGSNSLIRVSTRVKC